MNVNPAGTVDVFVLWGHLYFGSLHSYCKASSPVPWQMSVSGTPQALCCLWGARVIGCVLHGLGIHISAWHFQKRGVGCNTQTQQDAVPGASHPCLDAGCLWPVVNGTHQKKEETSQGWPEVAVSALGASVGAWPAAVQDSRETEGGTSCCQLPAPSFVHSVPSTLPPGVPIGHPEKPALLTKKISIPSFSSFFFLPFLKYCRFFFSSRTGWVENAVRRKYMKCVVMEMVCLKAEPFPMWPDRALMNPNAFLMSYI